MNKRVLLAVLATSVAALTGCHGGTSGAGSTIGLVDVPRITANWPKFLNDQNQLNADAQAVQQAHLSDAEKAKQMATLQARFAATQSELTDDVGNAARQVAAAKHLTYVFTQQYVGYGGVDITPDVEKILNITERVTPAP
jgi:Skp family chaperone for outer membrane proteins